MCTVAVSECASCAEAVEPEAAGVVGSSDGHTRGRSSDLECVQLRPAVQQIEPTYLSGAKVPKAQWGTEAAPGLGEGADPIRSVCGVS
ncbi:hypothetical protein NDU88_004964 [Pleurodeles waltl]|uniref:Uncharacterized protein n=1 Tax=Pleurodeles waltl TaxID=8319 RepID=A0AAV7L0W9_PLEWA|nr:hypothetical protein NDU88_004964 [Pleurodeles waltl]